MNQLQQMHEMIFIDNIYLYALKYIDPIHAKQWRKFMYNAMSYHILHLAEQSGKYLIVLRVVIWASKFWGLYSTLRFLKTYTYKRITKSNIISKTA